jgi:hypothetical protein
VFSALQRRWSLSAILLPVLGFRHEGGGPGRPHHLAARPRAGPRQG